MFKDLTGASDVCHCIDPSKFGSEPSLTYALPSETVFILLKAGKEEFIFTDRALIAVRGASAVSSKRLVSRYDYLSHPISRVQFETAGMGPTDRDCELKFLAGGEAFSIDIWKQETDTAKLFFKTLVELEHEISRNMRLAELSKMVMSSKGHSPEIFKFAVASQWAEELNQKYYPSSYAHVFQMETLSFSMEKRLVWLLPI